MTKNTSFRNARKKSFTQISNGLIGDKNITLEAKALLTIFLSNTEDWKIQMKEIITRSKNGRDAHYRVLDELIEHGYIARVEVRNKNGKFENQEYIFSDDKEEVIQEIKDVQQWGKENKKQIDITYCVKKEKKKRTNKKEIEPLPENQDTEIQDTDNRDSVNQYINNTSKQNTNRDNTNRDNTNSSSSSKVDNQKKRNKTDIKKEEEEKIINLCNSNVFYDVLRDFLKEKGKDRQTIIKTLLECQNRELELFTMEDIKNQYEHMMNKKHYGERIWDFAKYFAKGLKDLADQSKASKQYQQEKIREYELAMQKQQKRSSIYYNWLEN